MGRNGRILLERTGRTPYGYSSDTTDVGVRFKPAAIDELRIRITAHHPERLPEGELIIEPYWEGNVKDFLVSASLDADLRPIIVRANQVGIVLLIVGTIFLVFRRPSNTALEPSAR